MKPLQTGIKQLGADLLSLFYPNLCVSCNSNLHFHRQVICFRCAALLPKTNFHQHLENPMTDRLLLRMPLVYASSFLYFTKQGRVQEMIHQLKYKGRRDIGVKLGRLYGKDLLQSEAFPKIDMILPVPLHKKKERMRGYNQAAAIAEGLSESMKIETTDSILVRNEFTATQTRKSRWDRYLNVSEAFGIQKPELLTGKHILIVDDVITTGATIEACVNLLVNSAHARVSAVSLAVAI